MNSISVIIPAYNREAYVADAIESALNQSCPPEEIIVVDDGSTDRTAEIVRSYGKRVRCISQANQGIGGARNTGLKEARGSFIAHLDSDDLWVREKLALQTEYLRTHPGIDMVFCRMRPFLSPEIDPAMLTFDAREIEACNAGTLLARREVYEKAGLFPTARDGTEFFGWFEQACGAGLTSHILPQMLMLRRVHLTNSVRDPNSRLAYVRFLKRKLDQGRDSKPVAAP